MPDRDLDFDGVQEFAQHPRIDLDQKAPLSAVDVEVFPQIGVDLRRLSPYWDN